MAEEGANYTVDEAAQILGLSPARIRQMLRTGELEGERSEERIPGVLGPWRIPKRAVHTLRQEGDLSAHRAGRQGASEDVTTPAGPPLGATTSGTLPTEEDPAGGGTADTTPSEASELLSESVREVRERAEQLREGLGRLEGHLEAMEIAEFTLRESLEREKERAELERERADRLRAELEADRAGRRGEPREFWRRLLGR